MQFKDFLILNEVSQVGYQEIQAKKLFGPVYHGTNESNIKNILQSGFKFEIGDARTGSTAHGYEINDYAQGIPAPVHHLGYGVYFTQIANIAKKYQRSGKKLINFYLDIPRFTEINFALPNNMMKWWKANCYDMPPLNYLKSKSIDEIKSMRIESTKKLTECLSSQYDAVIYKGKGIRSLLDGNQICVYDASKIYMFNPELNLQNEFMPGDRVKLKEVQVAAEILSSRDNKSLRKNLLDVLFGMNSKKLYTVKIDSKSMNKIQDFFYPKIKHILLSDPQYQEFLEKQMQNFLINSKEEAADRYSLFWLKNMIKLNMPESLIEKKIPKGQRLN
jgi:hypothetical protein